MLFILTIDVERISFADNSYHDSIAKRVAIEGLPKITELLNKHRVKAPFYTTAKYAELQPESLKILLREGHEIGCHGYDHSELYDSMNYQAQLSILTKSKRIIEDEIEDKICSFRAPALRINKYTVKALEDAGFLTDSSVASQRFDGPFTSGAKKKLKWLFADRNPYMMSYFKPYKKGKSNILEIPVTAMVWPFIGTHMRISPFITSLFQKCFMWESKFTGKPLVFLFHPNECLRFSISKTKKRGNFFNDQLRHRAKMRNLGDIAIKLLEEVIIRSKKEGAEFITVHEYYERYNK